MSRPVTPPDSELAKIFGNNTRLFRAVRELFTQAGDLSPEAIEEALISAGTADAKAVQALDTLNRIADALDLISLSPEKESVGVDDLSIVKEALRAQDDLSPPIIPNVRDTLKVFHVRHEVANNVNGGDAAVGVNTRVLNTTVTNTITGASLLSDVITLPKGTYEFSAMGVGHDLNRHQAYIYDIDNNTTLIEGSSVHCSSLDTVVNMSSIIGVVILNAETDIELRHWSQSVKLATGFGIAVVNNVDTVNNVYAEVYIRKV